MKLNLIMLSASVARAYEIAKAGNFAVKLVAGSRSDDYTTSEADLQLLRNFYDMPDTDNPDIIVEVVYDTTSIIQCAKGLNGYETMADINERLEEYALSDIKVSRLLDNSCTELLKVAIERLSLDAVTAFKIVDIAIVIAKLGNSAKIKPEHIAEAIQYRSIEIPA